MKRLVDIFASALGLVVLSPVLVLVAVAIWLQDYRSPFYIASRTGRGDRPFRMLKFRSMVVSADRSGVDSTAGDDPRITVVGRFIRKFKLDEVPQLWNVLRGEMSLVGPRPNVWRETLLYTAEEKGLLAVRPGITDLASVVFSDEAEILHGSDDPDLEYNQVIRPWKSRLGLLYVHRGGGVFLDLRLIYLTLLNAFARPKALAAVAGIVTQLGGSEQLRQASLRSAPLQAAPPPGASEIVRGREIPLVA
ncbi:MAG TPA: sugar transferase [Gemmatimonadales bacterium]|nr:sugar transferase [Gemmatimonadales bacterium]